MQNEGFQVFKGAYIIVRQYLDNADERPINDFVSMLVNIVEEWKFEFNHVDALPLLRAFKKSIEEMIEKIEKFEAQKVSSNVD